MSNLHNKDNNKNNKEKSENKNLKDEVEFDSNSLKEHNSEYENKSTEEELDFEDVIFEEDESSRDVVKKLRGKLKSCMKEKQDYLLSLQRSRADYANLNRKAQEDQKKVSENEKNEVLKRLFQVMDSFEMAFSNEELWNSVDSDWSKGVEQIYSQLQSILKDYGIEQINPSGEDFNPGYHEPVEIIPTANEEEDNKIQEVLQRGYVKNEKVLRPARVKVGQIK